MAMSKVTGLDDARRVLKQLPDSVQSRVLRSSVRAGAAVVRREVKLSAPTGDDGVDQSPASKKYGRLKINVRILRLKRGVPKTSAQFRVDTGSSFWGYFIEFGTSKMAAKPWFRPAVDRAWNNAVAAIRERLGLGIEREAIKLSRGGK